MKKIEWLIQQVYAANNLKRTYGMVVLSRRLSAEMIFHPDQEVQYAREKSHNALNGNAIQRIGLLW
ncbi:MAG: hypothetical protein RR137_04210 [Odoribacter sp.]